MRSEIASPMVSSGVRSSEQLVDLEGAGDAAPHPLVRLERGDVVAFEQDAPGGRAQHAGEEVDHGGLAGAVRADQGMAGALLDRERDAVGRGDAAEMLVEAAGLEHDRHVTRPLQQRLARRSRPRIISTMRASRDRASRVCDGAEPDHEQDERAFEERQPQPVPMANTTAAITAP